MGTHIPAPLAMPSLRECLPEWVQDPASGGCYGHVMPGHGPLPMLMFKDDLDNARYLNWLAFKNKRQHHTPS